MSEAGIATLVAAAGRIEGRVKLQKMTYLLQQMGYDFGYRDFVFLLHGPYSDSLASDLDSAGRGMLSEKREPSGLRFSGTGEPVMRYAYEASEASAGPLEQWAREGLGDHWSDFVAKARELNGITSPLLEVVASAIYVHREEGIEEWEQVWQRVAELKDHRREFIERAKLLLSDWQKRGIIPA